ncbi:PREDICTED: aquaporin AQPAe.a-like [Ceratosolen solmsi marchali]|uniref:Aquaporin AQPAe.a-like n=1 Tax=Ceratosolen solmsi marchali TaxID=326594 RepID=A0AAJ6YDD1_9HYME|nr:PREDICTED: aquaporin AQPAe.a-like [Ceratosolen solmsi marchali]
MFHGNFSTKDIFTNAVAEFLGTAMLIFLGCVGCLGSLTVQPSHLQITLNFGLTVLIIIQCFGHISNAHINPAITVGAVILGKKTVYEAFLYFIAQIFGTIVGFGLLKIITPIGFLKASVNSSLNEFCITDLHPHVSLMQGLLIEGIATAILMFIACSIWDVRNCQDTDAVSIKFGLSVTALATSFGPYTGCSMNPVRSLGPAIWNNYWRHHWIYWLGPLGGALFASLIYKTIFSINDQDNREINIAENTALNCINLQKSSQTI